MWRDFYFGLLSSIPLQEEEQEQFLGSLERKLSPSESEACEGAVTEAECEQALPLMSMNKAPGVDRFPGRILCAVLEAVRP